MQPQIAPRPPRARRPIALSIFFSLCSVAYILGAVAFIIIALPWFGSGRSSGGGSSHSTSFSDAFFAICSIFAPFPYFVLSYICCRPQTTGNRLRFVFLASVLFLFLSILGIGFGAPIDSFSTRARSVTFTVLMSTPFVFASACLFYHRWGPPSLPTHDARVKC
jgi:hypothetical protein